MEAFFNELSMKVDCLQDGNVLSGLYELMSEMISHNIKNCRISSGDMAIIISEMKYNKDHSKMINIQNLCYGFFRAPYENNAVNERQDEYLSYRWYCQDVECEGLALSFIFDSISVSLKTCNMWETAHINIYKDNEICEVRNACDKKSFISHFSWLESIGDIELIETTKKENEKHIKLSDDHGKDKLLKMSKKIIKSPYVEGIIGSSVFNSHNRNFINEIHTDGIIRIVLPWTDSGYGMYVKTTGRNYRETKKIAEILQEKFGYI